MFVRYQASCADERGLRPGVFRLAALLGRDGHLSPKEAEFVTEHNGWYDTAYPTPGQDIYDPEHHPEAVAWFKIESCTHLIDRLLGYLGILDAHGVGWERVETHDPGRVIYEDDYQVVVVAGGGKESAA